MLPPSGKAGYTRVGAIAPLPAKALSPERWQHFDFYCTLPSDLRKAVAESRRRYPAKGEAELHVCLSHNQRRNISSRKQAVATKGQACVQVPAGDDPEYPAFVGTRVVGNSTSGRFINGARYLVTAVSQERLSLRDEATQKEFDATPEQIGRCTLLAWAMTYNKVQGATEAGTLMLHGCSSPNFKKCHLYVGLSRVTSGSNVFVATD